MKAESYYKMDVKRPFSGTKLDNAWPERVFFQGNDKTGTPSASLFQYGPQFTKAFQIVDCSEVIDIG